MFYRLKQAAAAVGKSKPTLLRAIQNGKISAQKDAHGIWQIDPAELHRVYPLVVLGEVRPDADGTDELSFDAVVFFRQELARRDVQFEQLRQERERERLVLETALADFRKRLDEASEERRRAQVQLTALLTDQRHTPRAKVRLWKWGPWW